MIGRIGDLFLHKIQRSFGYHWKINADVPLPEEVQVSVWDNSGCADGPELGEHVPVNGLKCFLDHLWIVQVVKYKNNLRVRSSGVSGDCSE